VDGALRQRPLVDDTRDGVVLALQPLESNMGGAVRTLCPLDGTNGEC